MKSMDNLKSLGNPHIPTAAAEQTPAEALQRLEQIQLELRAQVTRAASKGDYFDSTERLMWEIVMRTGHAAMELLIGLQGCAINQRQCQSSCGFPNGPQAAR